MNSAECVRVVQISEMDSIGHARGRTGRAQAFFHSMNAEMTLTGITDGGVPMALPFKGLAVLPGILHLVGFPFHVAGVVMADVGGPGAVGAGDNAVAAADALLVVDVDDAVITDLSCRNRADRGAGR